MPWGWGRGWTGPWPGRGPFSYLPPWQRPGWIFGRGACWWFFWPYAWWWTYPWYSYAWYPYAWYGYPFYWYPRYWFW